MKRYKCRRKFETSKVFVYLILGAVAVVVGLAFRLMARTGDLSALGEIIIGIFGLASVATGFYFNKAKAENKIKLKKENGIPLSEEDFDSEEQEENL